MNRSVRTTFAALSTITVVLAIGAIAWAASPEEAASEAAKPAAAPLPTVQEARERARLLHETVHATLQIVHRRYYREDEGLPIVAFTMRQVFEEVAGRSDVKLHWLVVEGDAMNVGHKARDEFEKQAVQELSDGKEAFEQADQGIYRRVAAITLGNDCLKCHVPNRTSVEDRTAGLVITMPVRAE